MSNGKATGGSPLQPNVGQGTAAPPSPTAGAEFRAFKAGDAIQRIGGVKLAQECVKNFDLLGSDDPEMSERLHVLDGKLLRLLEEAVKNLEER